MGTSGCMHRTQQGFPQSREISDLDGSNWKDANRRPRGVGEVAVLYFRDG